MKRSRSVGDLPLEADARDAALFRDVLTFIIPHLDVATFVELRQTCKTFWRAMRNVVPTPIQWYRQTLAELKVYRSKRLPYRTTSIGILEEVIHKRPDPCCARCHGLVQTDPSAPMSARFCNDCELYTCYSCARVSSNCGHCTPVLFAGLDAQIEALRRNVQFFKTVWYLRHCDICGRLGSARLDDWCRYCNICSHYACNACCRTHCFSPDLFATCRGCHELVCKKCHVTCAECHCQFCKWCDTRLHGRYGCPAPPLRRLSLPADSPLRHVVVEDNLP